jgi:hypothetical protein
MTEQKSEGRRYGDPGFDCSLEELEEYGREPGPKSFVRDLAAHIRELEAKVERLENTVRTKTNALRICRHGLGRIKAGLLGVEASGLRIDE